MKLSAVVVFGSKKTHRQITKSSSWFGGVKKGLIQHYSQKPVVLFSITAPSEKSYIKRSYHALHNLMFHQVISISL